MHWKKGWTQIVQIHVDNAHDKSISKFSYQLDRRFDLEPYISMTSIFCCKKGISNLKILSCNIYASQILRGKNMWSKNVTRQAFRICNVFLQQDILMNSKFVFSTRKLFRLLNGRQFTNFYLDLKKFNEIVMVSN